MNDTNFENRESVSTPIRSDEDQHLLQYRQNIQVTAPKTPNSPFSYPLSGNYGDLSPSPTYYATVQSTSSRRYAMRLRNEFIEKWRRKNRNKSVHRHQYSYNEGKGHLLINMIGFQRHKKHTDNSKAIAVSVVSLLAAFIYKNVNCTHTHKKKLFTVSFTTSQKEFASRSSKFVIKNVFKQRNWFSHLEWTYIVVDTLVVVARVSVYK